MKRALIVLLLVAVAAVSPTIAKKKKEPSDTSHEQSYYNFTQTSKDNITLQVYSYPAHWRKNQKAIPLWITVALGETEGGRGPFSFGLENFTLIDSAGNSSPTVPSNKLLDLYEEQMSDQNIMRERPVQYGLDFVNYIEISSSLYPAARNLRLTGGVVELDTLTRYAGFIYFPQPKAGQGGVLKLRMEGERLAEPIEVKFKIPK